MISATRLLLSFTGILLSTSSVEALWPLPRNLQTGSSALQLANDFAIKVSGCVTPDLLEAVGRSEWYLKNDKLERLVVGRGSGDIHSVSKAAKLHTLTLSLGKGVKVKSIASEATALLESRDEAYSLHVPDDGSGATLSANSTLGLFRGLTTFSQLWYSYETLTYALDAPIAIEDSPAYVRSFDRFPFVV